MRKIPALIIAALILLSAYSPVSAADTPLKVYYAGPDGPVKTALDLAEFAYVSSPVAADVIVLNGRIPNPDQIAAEVQSGKGLLLVMGPELTAEMLAPLLGESTTLEARSEAASLSFDDDSENELISGIYWISAPQVRDRMAILTPQPSELVRAHQSDEVILGEIASGAGKVFVFTPYLAEGLTSSSRNGRTTIICSTT